MFFFARVRFCTQLFYPCIRGSFSESGTIRSTIICILYYRSFLVNVLPALRPFQYFLVAERSPLNRAGERARFFVRSCAAATERKNYGKSNE